MNHKLIPELRFPEFVNDGEWGNDTVNNIIFTIPPPKKLSTAQYFDNGKYQIIDQSKSLYCGWTDDEDGVISKNLPLIIFGDHTCILKLAFKPFVQGADGIKIIKPKKTLTTEFLYYTCQNNEVKQEEYKRHFSILKERNVTFPNVESGEQQKIASCLSSLDQTIAAHSQKLNALKNHKKGLMQNLFPQEGETVPNYRFPEFENDGDWEENLLGDEDISFFVNEKISVNKLNINSYISTENMLPEFGGINPASKLPSAGNFTKYDRGDILISNIRPYLNKIWKSDDVGGASNDVIVFRAGKNMLSDFLEFILKNALFIKYVMEGAKGVKMPRGDKESMKKYVVLIPSQFEQQKIASTLSSLDKTITAQSEKIERLKLHKKGLMQGLFPSKK